MTIHHLHAEEATDVSQFFQIHPENPQARLIKQAVEIIRNGGVVVYDSSSCQPRAEENHIAYGIPVSDIARLEMRNYLTKNIVVLGVLSKLFGIDFTILETIVKQKLGKKGEAILNLNYQIQKHPS